MDAHKKLQLPLNLIRDCLKNKDQKILLILLSANSLTAPLSITPTFMSLLWKNLTTFTLKDE